MSIQKYFSLLSFSIISILATNNINAQIVGETKLVKLANVKVYTTTYLAEADVVVFKTPYKKNAEGNKGIWYFSSFDGEMNKKICYVPSKVVADLVVYFTNNKDEVGWRNKKKKYLFD